MAQHDYNIANQTGLEFRADINNLAQAIATQNSGPTEPTTTYAGMVWLDTSTSPPIEKRRNAANNGWETTLTEAGRTVAGAANVAAQRTALGLGSAALLTVGTAANNVVQLDSSARLPAVDGSQLTGLQFQSVVDQKIYTSGSGTWTKPVGLSATAVVEILLLGGGASGSSRATTGNAGGGAGGPVVVVRIPASRLSATENYVVAASVAGVSGDSVGNPGNPSTFTIGGVVLSSGQADSSTTAATGGVTSATGLAIPSFGGVSIALGSFLSAATGAPGGQVTASNVPNRGSSAEYSAGGGGASSTSGGIRTGGVSVQGGAGGAGGAFSGGNGGNGTAPGGGGGAAVGGGTSGAGAAGEIRVTVFD